MMNLENGKLVANQMGLDGNQMGLDGYQMGLDGNQMVLDGKLVIQKKEEVVMRERLGKEGGTLELRLVRIARRYSYTIGQLFVDGEKVKLCDTLEPRCRDFHFEKNDDFSKKEKKVRMVKQLALEKKPNSVLGRTAIPEGRYRVEITRSMKFGRPLPLLMNVPGFSGIRIHQGNFPNDTQGCILVGANSKPGMVLNSMHWLLVLIDEIVRAQAKGKKIYISIVNRG